MINLRYYQSEAISAVLSDIRSGYKRLLVDLPPGAGKSFTMAALCGRANGRVVCVTNQPTLAFQNMQSFSSYGVGDLGLLSEGAGFREVNRKVTVASTMTLLNAIERGEFSARGIMLVVIDEGHRAPVEGEDSAYMRLFSFFPDAYLVAFTGSPFRHNIPLDKFSPHPAIKPFWQKISYRMTIQQGEAEGFLVPMTTIGDESERNLRLTYCINKQHARDEAEKIGCPVILDDTPEKEKLEIIDAARNLEIHDIVNCGCLSTGIDIKPVDCIILKRPLESFSLFLQILGRAARPYPGKKNYLLKDYGGAIEKLGHWFDDPILASGIYENSKPGDPELQCPKCSTMNSGAAKRCRGFDATSPDKRCTFRFVPGVPCVECGFENDENAVCCASCGNWLKDINERLYRKAYSDEELRMVVGKKMYTVDEYMFVDIYCDDGSTCKLKFWPFGKTRSKAKTIFYNDFVKKFVAPENQSMFMAASGLKGVVKLERLTMTPTQISYRINRNGNCVLGRVKYD